MNTINNIAGMHLLSPTAVYIMLLMAMVIDYVSVGPNSIRDRLAFAVAVACITEGFNGSSIDKFIVGAVGGVIDETKRWSGDAYIADANTNYVIGGIVTVAWIFTIGVMLPAKAHKRLGRFAQLTFECKTRLNWKLWGCAIFHGLTTDLAQGWLGHVFQVVLKYDTFIVAIIARILFRV